MAATQFPTVSPSVLPTTASTTAVTPSFVAEVSALTCDELGWDAVERGSSSVCGESDGFSDVLCPGFLTFVDAVAYCEDGGARMCTVEELNADEAAFTGCGYDNVLVWSGTACGGGQDGSLGVLATFGASRGGLTSVCANLEERFAPRCCADVHIEVAVTLAPSHEPTAGPTQEPTLEPTENVSPSLSPAPTAAVTVAVTSSPSPAPTAAVTIAGTPFPSPAPLLDTPTPTPAPSQHPSMVPTVTVVATTLRPTQQPTLRLGSRAPTLLPTPLATEAATSSPTTILHVGVETPAPTATPPRLVRPPRGGRGGGVRHLRGGHRA